MAFNPNVQNNKTPQDSPFLTLSQRTQQGISSDNIKGTQQAYSTQKTENTNIFGQEEAQGVKQDGAGFQQEEKGADEYLQEDEQGNVGFDEQGFYDDAWGISLSKATTDPIKAGGSQDAHSLKNDLETAVKQGKQDAQVNEIKDQLEAQGVSTAEIDTIEQKAQGNSGMQKAGASAQKSVDSSNSTTVASSDQAGGMDATSFEAWQSNPNSCSFGAIDAIGGLYDKGTYETMQATATARNKDGSAKTSSSTSSTTTSSSGSSSGSSAPRCRPAR